MRVLVTGGSGFIGSHVVDKLAAAGHTPVIFDPAGSPWPEHAGVKQVRGSILDREAIADAAHPCDVIVHLAAAADVGEVAEDAPAAEELNTRGTLNVLEAARRHGCRVVYASTIWVYSDTDGDLLAEEDPLSPPAHIYSATKLAGELYCHSYRELFGVRSTVLRFGIPYGPRARPAAVLPIFVDKALAGEPLTIAGDGRQTRRFVYVEDLAEGVVAALDDQAADRTYNLVGEEDTSVRDIADAVGSEVGDVEIAHVEGRAGDFAGAVISGERARSELGWSPVTPFREGVARYVAWHRAHAERDAVAAPEAVPVPVRATAAAAAAASARSLSGRLGARTPLTVACFVLLAYVIALASMSFGSARIGTVVAASALLLVAIDTRSVVPSGRGLATGTTIGLMLLAIPPVAHAAEIAALSVQLLIISAIGAAGALSAAAAAERYVRDVAVGRS